MLKIKNIVVGSGIAGAVIARRLAEEKNEKVLVVERRNYIGGYCYDYRDENGILIHLHGPHIFRTHSEKIWNFLSRFTEWYDYQHKVLANVGGKNYPMPINLDTVNLFLGTHYDSENVEEYFENHRIQIEKVENVRQVIESQIGSTFYHKYERSGDLFEDLKEWLGCQFISDINKLTNWAEIDRTIANPLGTSLRTPATWDWIWTGFMPDDPTKIGTDEEHWSLMTVSDESKEVVRLLADMYANNGIHNGVGTLVDEDDGYAAFNNGTLASYGYSYGYYTQFKKLYDSWMSANPDGSLADITLGTALKDDEGNWMQIYDVPVYLGSHYFIPTSCEYPERVLDLVEFLASNEGQKLIFCGIEGLTYTMDGDDIVFDIEEITNINKHYGYPYQDTCRYVWFTYLFCTSEMMLDLEDNDWWEAVTTPYDPTMDWATGEDKEVFQYALDTVQEFVDEIYVVIPSYYGMATLDAEWADVQTKLYEITNRYLAQMVGGQLDIDTGWEQYRAEYEAAGGPGLEEAVNEAIAIARTEYST